MWVGGGNCAQSRGANRSQSEETATANSQVKQARPWLLKSIVGDVVGGRKSGCWFGVLRDVIAVSLEDVVSGEKSFQARCGI